MDTTTCVIENCDRTGKLTRGMCAKHYMAARRNGTVPTKTCTFEGCEKPLAAKGLCTAHYMQRWSGADLAPLRAPAGQWGQWTVSTKGYVVRRRKDPETGERVTQFQHRVVMEEMLGRPLRDIENVHHINGNRADNRPENLELWVSKQPVGQRPEDLLAYAREIIALYG